LKKQLQDPKKKNFTSPACANYTQPPYRYYADSWNWNTIVAASLAAVFNPNFRQTPEPNSPYWTPFIYSPDCEDYMEVPGFEFWLDDFGNMDEYLFSVMTIREAPYSFIQHNFPSIQASGSGNIFLSIGYNDTTVDPEENIQFSELLTTMNISHTFFLYEGTHREINAGFMQCLLTFSPNFCKSTPVPPSPDNVEVLPSQDTLPYIIGMSVLGILLFATLVALVAFWVKRSMKYERLP